jgi:hypothetical protein
MPGGVNTSTSNTTNAIAAAGRKFVAELKTLEGDPYVYGAAGPAQFDCSGLVQYGLEKIGVPAVPRTSEAQWAWIKQNGTVINKGQLQPGDLIFSQWPGDNASPGHVQVYLGGGQVIQAPHPGGTVSTAPLSADTGHIVGYGRVPHLENAVTGTGLSGLPGFGAGQDIGGLIGEAGTLLHGIAEMLDFAFGLFAPGQGWRMAFGALAIGSGIGAVKAYTSGGDSMGGASFPVAVGLAGVATLSAFMALRTWPQEAKGPEKPGAYLAEILEGQPPPPGPKRVHETDTIEAGLAVFAVAWLAQKASSLINTVITSITGALGALGLVALA